METTDSVDVAVLVIAIDAQARAAVQGELEALARSGDTREKAGLVRLLVETTHVLERSGAAWRFAGATNATPMPRERARAAFTEAAQRARGRFKHELVRNAHGVLTVGDAPPLPTPADDAGFVVVTLVVAASRELSDVADPSSRDDVKRVLADLRAVTAAELVALEVVWSPAAADDRLSEAALRRMYPEVRPIS